MPVLGHLEGLCIPMYHAFRRSGMAGGSPSMPRWLGVFFVCGATETLLIDPGHPSSWLPDLAARLVRSAARCAAIRRAVKPPQIGAANDADWITEYWPDTGIRVGGRSDEAIDHIGHFVRDIPKRSSPKMLARRMSSPGSIAQSCCGMPRPNLQMAANSALARRSESPPVVSMPAARSAPNS